MLPIIIPCSIGYNQTMSRFLPLVFTLALILSAQPAFADFSLGDAIRLRGGEEGSVSNTYGSFSDIISTILPNAYIAAGVILLFFLFFGGFTIIASADNPEKTQKGRQAIVGAIIGFIVIFTSFWIVQIIQIITGVNFINPIINL